jgi:hypothetical protein
MPQTKKYNSPADRLRAFRERQKASQNPTVQPVEAEDLEPITQLSRAAGVPRSYPLSVWKVAAEALIVGPNTTPAERRAGKPTKVQTLKSFCATDKAWRKRVADFVRTSQAEAARKYAEAQGWKLATDGATPKSLVDRMVEVLERGERLEDHFTAEEINSAPPDPAHDKLWADYQHYLKTGEFPGRTATHGCNTCGFNNGPATRTIEIGGKAAHFCDVHDGKRTGSYLPPAEPQSPAAYINSGFGKDQNGEAFDPDRPQAGDTPYIAGLKALRRAQQDAAAIVPRGSHYGATPEGAIVVSVMSSPDEK